ncbi:MAG: hypothetical protein IIA05_00775 [Proteobacteria bacterium]|nr:hypothetical protein [Pseudomonadota bacterium]
MNGHAHKPDALRAMADRAGSNLRAVIFFGSHLVNSAPGQHSAADWVVIVDEYRPFYREFSAWFGYPAVLVALLNRLLPPNVIHIPAAEGAGIKAVIISAKDFARAMGARAKDHFCKGRLVQKVEIIYARDDEVRERVNERLLDARMGTLDWVPLYADEKFTVESYCLAMMQTSYGAEIRPESNDRVLEVIAQQQTSLIESFKPVLDAGIERGVLTRDERKYRLTRPPGKAQKWRWRWYFRKSKIRATLRWLKYVMTFTGWPDYIVRKLERRSGIKVELTDAERRWPLVLMWPKIIRNFVRLQRSKKSSP